ncbi:MAG: response regulator transcription factor [Candidatus Limnocylindrales bacterium]
MHAGTRPPRARILVVEDEARLRELLRLYLERAGYEVLEAGDGRAALDTFDADPPDLLIVDLMLPKLQGEALIRAIREDSQVPILIASAKRTDVERIAGLRLGADDYLPKPFNVHELVERVNAILRRTGTASGAGAMDSGRGPGLGLALDSGRGPGLGLALDPGRGPGHVPGVGIGADPGGHGAPAMHAGTGWGRIPGGWTPKSSGAPTRLSFHAGRFVFDVATRAYTRDGQVGRLTPAEARLLLALVRAHGAPLDRDRLLRAAGGPHAETSRNIDVHVGNLRRKLGDDAAAPWAIETIPDVGYRWIASPDAPSPHGAPSPDTPTPGNLPPGRLADGTGKSGDLPSGQVTDGTGKSTDLPPGRQTVGSTRQG